MPLRQWDFPGSFGAVPVNPAFAPPDISGPYGFETAYLPHMVDGGDGTGAITTTRARTGTHSYGEHFFINSAVGNTDNNIDIDEDFRPGHGSTFNTLTHFFTKGYWYLDTPYQNPPPSPVGRKLLYIMNDSVNNSRFSMVVGGFDYVGSIAYLNPSGGLSGTLGCDFAPRFVWPIGQWFGIKVEVKMNTVGQSDGYIQVWVYDATGDTQLFHQLFPNLDMGNSGSEYLEVIKRGEQADVVLTGQHIDEWRYIDDISTSTQDMGAPTIITSHPSILSLAGDNSGSPNKGQALAASQSNLATASKLAFKLRVKGDKLITGDSTTAPFDLLQLYDPGVGRKIGCQIFNTPGGLVQLALQTLDGNGNVFTTGYAKASIDPTAYYRLYFHYDQTQTTDKQHLSLYDDSGTLLDDKTSNYSGGVMGTAGTGGAFALNRWVMSSSTNLSVGSYDWVAFYDGALAVGAGRYSKPTSGDTGILSGWDMDAGTGTSEPNIVGGGQALSIIGFYNWL